MKHAKMTACILAAALCLSVPTSGLAASSSKTTTAKKTVKKGLKKENGKYYYYKNGKKVKNKWVTIKSGKTKYKYYFGKNGAAYMGKKEYGVSVPAVKKIGKYYYGFDTRGRMIKGTYYINGKFYTFSSSTGKMSSTNTKKLRSASKYRANYATLKKLLSKLGVKPKKTEYFGYSCYGDGEDGLVTYKNFKVSVFKNTKGKVIVLGVFN